MTYDAFISYSHAADGKLAPALQAALHRFAKPWYRRRALHLFRDETSLSASPGLWPSIETALASSRYFLLLASPEAARSVWVQREIDWWLEHRSSDTLLIALTDGNIAWDHARGDFDWTMTDALPPSLAEVFPTDPDWVDLRFVHGEAQLSPKDARFQDAVADLAATLHNRPKDELFGEDVRQHQRALRLAGVAITALVLLLVAAVVATVLALGERDRADAEAAVARTAEAEAESQAMAAATAENRAETRRVEAEVARQEAENQARVALARQLAAQAISNPDELDLSLLLSLEANRLNEGAVDARGSLITALEMNPRLRTFLHGHQDWVQSLTFSPTESSSPQPAMMVFKCGTW